MSFTNAQLATKISDLIDYWSVFSAEYSNWLGGTVTGGPGSDGDYPLTDYIGNESLVACPAKLEDDVLGYVGLASASETAAAASAAAASTSESNAATSASTATSQAALADADRVAAELAETNAQDSAVTSTAQANLATARVTYAAEWANKAFESLVSAAAGGDEVDDYSALHWATVAEGFAGSVDSGLYGQLAQAESVPGAWTFDSTHIGKSVHSINTFATGEWDQVEGWAGMVHQNSFGVPVANHGYWHILGRRDTAGGYGGIYQEYSNGKLYSGYNATGGDPTWKNIWTSGDFANNSANWNTAYGWGDWAGHTHDGIADTDLVDKSADESISGSWQVWRDESALLRQAFHNTASSGFRQIDLHLDAQAGEDLYIGINYLGTAGAFIDNRTTGNLSFRDNGSIIAALTPAGALSASSFAATGTVTGSNLNVSNWDTAYGWGDHSGLYAPLAGINYANWNTAYGWGNHASAGYLTGPAATDSPSTGTDLSTNDLNNYEAAAEAGFYFQNSNADTSGNNYPNGHAGSLLVSKSAGVTQLYQTYNGSNKLFWRAYYSAAWTAWNEAVDTLNAQTIGGAKELSGSLKKTSGGHFVYYDSATYASAKITVSASAPGSPSAGDIWFDTS